MNEKVNGTKRVPPNGGWGWVIVLAYAINGVSTIPIFQGFGLIFKDTFPMFGFTATDVTVIMNTNLAFGMILGLVNGPLLQRFGYRAIAVAGTLTYTIGVTLTAFADTFPLIMFSYGILASVGMGLTMSAFSFAVNSYFTTRRGRAMGLALTMTGLGPILMPQLTSFLISYYGFQGTMLIYGALTLHSLIGAALLQPVQWHMREESSGPGAAEEAKLMSNREDAPENGDGGKHSNSVAKERNLRKESSQFQRKRTLTGSSVNHEKEPPGIKTALPRQLSVEIFSASSLESPTDGEKIPVRRPYARRFSELAPVNFSPREDYPQKSMETVHLGSSFRIFEEISPELMTRYYSMDKIDRQCSQEERRNGFTPAENGPGTEIADPKKGSGLGGCVPVVRRALNTVARFYHLDLLQDPIYVNILIGMAIAIFAEINFSVLTPFILAELGLSTQRIATAMSLIASMDLIFRSAAPFLGEWLHQPARIMYLTGLILLILSRTSLMFAHGFTGVLIVALGLGAAKGIRSVYMSLVVPSHVPIHMLPYASGIQMVVNGVILISAGPLLGVIRDYTGSYAPCITVINCVTSVTVALWAIEILILRRPKSTGLSVQREGKASEACD